MSEAFPAAIVELIDRADQLERCSIGALAVLIMLNNSEAVKRSELVELIAYMDRTIGDTLNRREAVVPTWPMMGWKGSAIGDTLNRREAVAQGFLPVSPFPLHPSPLSASASAPGQTPGSEARP